MLIIRGILLRENRVKILFYVFLIVILTFPRYIGNSKADIVIISTPGSGNFLPVDNCSLIMTNANVIFNIDYPRFSNKIDINFIGNYTVYNPNESQNMTLVAPFSPYFKNLESTCLIKVGENFTPFSFIEYYIGESPWEQYLDPSTYFLYSRKFAVINVTFPENDYLVIEYSFDAYIDGLSSVDGIQIYYDVGTSRAWNGTITERVKFNVFGKLPNSYLECDPSSFNYNCAISDIESGRSYAWEWENESILINSVYISYSFYRYFWGRITMVLIPLLIIGLPILIIVIKKIRERYKKYPINS